MHRRNQEFQTVRSEGGLLPPDLLRRVLDPKEGLDGTRPEDYGLPQGERLNEVITQSWNRLRKHWAEFRAAAEHLPEMEPGTGLTNEKWSLPLLRELGFGLLPTTAGPEIGGRTYAINRFFGPVPIHLVGCGLSLDRRAAGVRGAAAANPHGLVQEFINRSPVHLWAIVSNGLRIRLLRNNQALSRQSFLEFDLEAMFAGELYSDFVLLWLMAHATRFAPREGDKPDTCWLEQWTKLADEQGTRALGELRGGVEKALQILGEGFTSHPKNTTLRDGLRTGQVSLSDFHGQLLRIVYRLIFLFVAEDRTLDGLPLLHPRDDSDPARKARERFALHYGTGRLREMAAKIKGSRHGDLWRQFQIIVGALSGDASFTTSREALALPPLGSFLWDPRSTSALNSAELTNHDFLEALRDLAFTRQGKMLRPVDYENLGAEELGGVYESLLALTPQISADGALFTFAEFAGNERKTSGSYYTPDSLVQCLLDSALDPAVEEAIQGKSGLEAEKAILALKVCDPAVGSGHFLVGAAHRIARHLARVRAVAAGESEPSPLLYQHALRDVIGHCLYGVDVNPMATELCRVSLWLEALEPGKPLSFLEHRIQSGNSLLGTTPALLAKGIPDEVFTRIEGDDKDICKEFKRINKDERNRQLRLFAATTEPWQQLGNLAVSLVNLDAIEDDSLDGIREKQRLYEETIQSADYLSGRFWSDSWCSAFAWKKTREFNYPITEGVFRRIEQNPHAVDPWMRDEIRRLAAEYNFFHWHLAFPDVFRVPAVGQQPENKQTGWNGGFDLVLGNPPWERVKLQEKEWFASIRPDIANLSNADERQRAIARLERDAPSLYMSFLHAARHADAENHLAVNSGRFPLSSEGDTNTYSLFAEIALQLRRHAGYAGMILPTGIVADHTNRKYFQAIIEARILRSVYDFENRARELFPEIYYRMRFCLLTIGPAMGMEDVYAPDFMFFAQRVSDLANPELHFTLTAKEIKLLNPDTRTCPIFRTGREANIIKDIYQRVEVLGQFTDIAHWHLIIRQGLFHQTNDAKLLVEQRSSEKDSQAGAYPDADRSPDYVPVYEGRMVGMYDHRAASVGFSAKNTFRSGSMLTISDLQKEDPIFTVDARFLAPKLETAQRIPPDYNRQWFLAFKDVSSATNERTLIASIIPRTAVMYTIRVVFPMDADAYSVCCLLADWNSLCTDYVCRSNTSGNHVSEYIIRQIPVHGPLEYRRPCLWDTRVLLQEWISNRVAELIYTAWDLTPFAEDLGLNEPPFRWDSERRFLLQCELDAAYLRLYCLDRGSTEYLLDAFRIVRERDEQVYKEYRTKRVILEIYDAMAEAEKIGVRYQTCLDPPPADQRCRHPKPNIGILAFGSLINDPGDELKPRIIFRIKTQTPFSIEYGRYSGKTRGGAPTLVPHGNGSPVSAEILVLDDSVTVDEATDMLWRRELRKVGSGETYVEGSLANSVLVRQLSEDPRVNTILYTNFHDAGKIQNPTASDLAARAIQSVAPADNGKDGISYLANAIKCGIQTPLTRAYRDEILRQTNTPTLEEALSKTKEEVVGRRNAGRHE